MKLRHVLEQIGFLPQEAEFTDEQPGYVYDFGNWQLEAVQLTSLYLVPHFQFNGIVQTSYTLAQIAFEMPLEIESREQAIAWIAYGLRPHKPANVPQWLTEGAALSHLLPWERKRAAFEARPQCMVEKEWFRIAVKKLRQLPPELTEVQLLHVTFTGELLRFTLGDLVIICPASGTPWGQHYAIKASELHHLPKRLQPLVHVSVWEDRLHIHNRAWRIQAQL